MKHFDARNEVKFDARRLWLFDCETETWKAITCVNEEEDENVPPTLSGACAISFGDKVYLFGGHRRSVIDGSSDIYFNDLFELDLRKFEWRKCLVRGDLLPSPRSRCAGWHHENKYCSQHTKIE